MSPSKKRVKNIKVHVPRHNSQRIGPALTAQIETIAKEKRIRTDVRQPTNEATSTIALAIESASEWNSLLLTARAERGPQWDLGTQQFQVEEGSNLYYDPSPLLEYQKEEKQAPHAVEGLPSSSSNPQLSQRGQLYPMAGHHSTNGVAMSPVVATPTRQNVGQMGGPYGGPQFHAIPPNQFYGGGDRGSPMVTRGMGVSMGMEGMGITPDVRSLSRRM